ncbi:membrane-bound lytic murein transglycosylase MltF [Cycloclasticus sp.]|uniref:membrane-bound lytic murein transglycosylase MltF n=1 Tax=Cycloclasticus sp. TaxID=2024830 RepID=UPI000C120A25|nr:membrane-bound lytic murein transglycosylase MltF [Cycloclasticus sp.]PHR51889.1 MAG: membrane-bound lytic murein transglycosylase MltF [Cycloclasticus sp.]
MLSPSRIKYVFIFLAVSVLSGCTPAPSSLEKVLNRGELVVLTRIDPSTYIIDEAGTHGFEYELTSLFAEKLGVNIRFIIAKEFQQLVQLSTEDEADFVAAGLSITPDRKKRLHFTPPYYEVTQQLVYHYRTRRPKSVAKLTGSFLEVIANTSHAENLRSIQKTHKNLSWIESTDSTVLELVSLVNDHILDYTVVDSNQFQLIRGQFPNLNVAFDISKPEKIAWAFPLGEDHSLYNEAVKFLAELKSTGVLEQLQDKHFGYSKQLDYVGICTFWHHADTRLPKLIKSFHLAAKKYNLDWKLLAAVAYQESHWNKHAVSPTGVRGIMMLTKATAKQMNVTNRLDPEQSIEGGAHYLSTRIKKIPKRIEEPDRTWMALAAYNIGFGHLEDARILTQQQGGDPDKWIDVKQRLPLLAEKEWYQKTKYGYARGKEPVTYIDNVRQYIKMLKKLEPNSLSDEQNKIDTDATLNIELQAL